MTSSLGIVFLVFLGIALVIAVVVFTDKGLKRRG